MDSSTARPASSGRSARSAHCSGCSVKRATEQASWFRVVSVPAMSTACASIAISSVESRSPSCSIGDQVAEEVVARVGAPLGDHVAHVVGQLLARLRDQWQVFGQVVVEDAEDVGGPGREQLPVLGWRTQQLADDRDRVRLADVGHQLALAPVDDAVRPDSPTTLRMVGRSRLAEAGVKAGATRRRRRACPHPPW